MTRDHAAAVAALHDRYRDAARAGDWQSCADLARQVRGLVRDLVSTAEASYAVGYALEMLGDTAGAESNYQLAVVMHPRHDKARRRLQRLTLAKRST